MNAFDRRTRRILGPLLGAAVLSTSLLVPLLDRTAAVPDAALETEHHAATCLAGHDHTICTQVGANLPGPGDGHPAADPDRLGRVASPPTPTLALPPLETDANPSRAPPFL